MKKVSALGFSLCLLVSAVSSQPLDMTKLKGFKPRNIGPAGMSGRVAAVAAAPSDPDLMYVGAASGGVWKSTSGGIAWEPVFDDQPVPSIGALAIDPHNTDVVWVGTGEGNPRNSAAVGNGIFKSLDGGRSWMSLGLENTERIHRILINPQNTDIVYAAAMGTTWGENPERGVYRTDDGGQSWKRVLFVDEKTGAADLEMDPLNPNKLIAAMWQHRRWPWFFKSGGPGSGLFVTYDGGETWKRRTHEDGLPEGELGRIGLGIARSNPQIVYALVEAQKNGVYKSEDGGFKWQKINDSNNINPRPFYYADIRIDPKNENRIYALHGRLTVSEDGGKSFKTVVESRVIHGDHHALWIHPDDPAFLINGNDGGVAISKDMGKTWRFVENLPLAQFYHIAIDNETPYNVYGGLQDNGSWRGPSQVLTSRNGILNLYWARVGGGDGFATAPDVSDPSRTGFGMSQGGNLYRFDLVTGERKSIKPAHPEGTFLRFNWNAAIAQDPFQRGTIYYGSQFVHRSTDRGESWEIISPDLTTDDPEKQKQLDSGGITYDATGAENHTTILTIAPSPVQQGLIWVGTDDGNVHVTRDGGKTWADVSKNIKGVSAGIWAPHIEPSRFSTAEAFVVFDDHRRSNWTPYVFRTNNYGKSWKSLATEDIKGFVHVIEQDPVEKNLLFLGTEFGLHVSIDGGENWTKWSEEFPTAPVRALVVHPREHDLVIGTHGRAAWIIDDIRPLRALAKQGTQILDKPLHLFHVADAVQYSLKEPNGLRGPGHAEFFGDNREYGAIISYVVNPSESSAAVNGDESKDKEVKIEILDQDGEVIRTMTSEAKAGLNRTAWELRRKAYSNLTSRGGASTDGERTGHLVLAGEYGVRLTYGDYKDSTSVTVLADPRKEVRREDMIAKYSLIQLVGNYLEKAQEAVDRLNKTKESVTMVGKKLTNDQVESLKYLKQQTSAVQDSIKSLVAFIKPARVQGIRRDPDHLSSRLSGVYRSLQSSWDAPTEAEQINLRFAEDKLASVLDRINGFYDEAFESFRQDVTEAGLKLFDKYEPLTVK
jgi:photosystem II stability/assembly factor-like uncharacterized protein